MHRSGVTAAVFLQKPCQPRTFLFRMAVAVSLLHFGSSGFAQRYFLLHLMIAFEEFDGHIPGREVLACGRSCLYHVDNLPDCGFEVGSEFYMDMPHDIIMPFVDGDDGVEEVVDDIT